MMVLIRLSKMPTYFKTSDKMKYCVAAPQDMEQLMNRRAESKLNRSKDSGASLAQGIAKASLPQRFSPNVSVSALHYTRI